MDAPVDYHAQVCGVAAVASLVCLVLAVFALRHEVQVSEDVGLDDVALVNLAQVTDRLLSLT